MSEDPKRTPLKLAGGGCVGVYGLVVVILLVATLVWRSSVVSMLERAQHERELYLADVEVMDATRARLIARAGLDAVLADLCRQAGFQQFSVAAIPGCGYLNSR